MADLPPAFQEICSDPTADDDELRKQAMEKARADYSSREFMIHRFPSPMRLFVEEARYILPKMVAIGPYHRLLPELQAMEVVKKKAQLFFCDGASLEAYEKEVAGVAGAARACYDAHSLEGISDTAFASMMFHDACFLLAAILAITGENQFMTSVLCLGYANASVVITDMFLLENQIPWVVLQALMTLKKMDLGTFIAKMGMDVQSRIDRKERPLELNGYKPPHLLGLFHFYQSGRSHSDCKIWCDEGLTVTPFPASQLCSDDPRSITKFGIALPPLTIVMETLPLGTSAVELAEIGIEVTASKTSELQDIGVRKGPLFRKIFLPLLRLNEHTACWLVNMAAFEEVTAFSDGDYIVSSYLSLFAMFMDREEDVHELRAKRLIHGEFTDKQTLDFFKGHHAGSLHAGYQFYRILRRLERYKQKWWLWIAVHKFVYKNFKTIVAVLSIVAALAGIFKALISLQKR